MLKKLLIFYLMQTTEKNEINNKIFNSVNNSINTKNIKTRQFEKKADEKSKSIFEFLCSINDNQKSLNLDFLRKVISQNRKKLVVKENVIQNITNYHLSESIKNGKFTKEYLYDEVLNQEEFSNLITGKNLKKLLFAKQDFEAKRFSCEEYGKLFHHLGGDKSTISKEKLKKKLIEAYQFYNNIDTIPNEENLKNNLPQSTLSVLEEEINEIFIFLSTTTASLDSLSLKDFINAMTTDTGDFDNYNNKIFN